MYSNSFQDSAAAKACLKRRASHVQNALKTIDNHIILVETPRKFITAKLSIRKPGSSSVLII
jgi:hypothetical protein